MSLVPHILLQQVCRDYTGLANDGYCNTKGYYPTSKFTRSTRPSGYQTTGSTARSHSDEKMTGELLGTRGTKTANARV